MARFPTEKERDLQHITIYLRKKQKAKIQTEVYMLSSYVPRPCNFSFYFATSTSKKEETVYHE
jgi:hypothetical protein